MKQLTLELAKKLSYGTILHYKKAFNSDGTMRRYKVNGKVKTWKRDINRVKIPVKHGLYTYGYITEDDIIDFMID